MLSLQLLISLFGLNGLGESRELHDLKDGGEIIHDSLPECTSSTWPACSFQPRSVAMTSGSIGSTSNSLDQNPSLFGGGKVKLRLKSQQRESHPRWVQSSPFTMTADTMPEFLSLTKRESNKKRSSHRRGSAQSVLAKLMLAESASTFGSLPRPLSGALKSRKPFPAMTVSMTRHELRGGAGEFDIEIRNPESLTKDECHEAWQNFHMDWSHFNPDDRSYDANRQEDIIILAKDRRGSFIGFAYGKRVEPELWWLSAFMVISEKQGRGIGTQLVRELMDYIVRERNAKAIFSSTQIHRISSLKAQRNAYDRYFSNGQALPPHGIGYYQLGSIQEEPPSAIVLFPLVRDITPPEVFEWNRLIKGQCYRSAQKFPSNFLEFLNSEGFTSLYRSDDPFVVISGMFEDQGCPSAIAGELTKLVLPMVDSLDGDATEAASRRR